MRRAVSSFATLWPGDGFFRFIKPYAKVMKTCVARDGTGDNNSMRIRATVGVPLSTDVFTRREIRNYCCEIVVLCRWSSIVSHIYSKIDVFQRNYSNRNCVLFSGYRYDVIPHVAALVRAWFHKMRSYVNGIRLPR